MMDKNTKKGTIIFIGQINLKSMLDLNKIYNMSKLIEVIFNHLENWGTFWFGFLFWGSIFGAILTAFFSAFSSSILIILGYFFGIIFGLISNFKKWSWIN